MPPGQHPSRLDCCFPPASVGCPVGSPVGVSAVLLVLRVQSLPLPNLRLHSRGQEELLPVLVVRLLVRVRAGLVPTHAVATRTVGLHQPELRCVELVHVEAVAASVVVPVTCSLLRVKLPVVALANHDRLSLRVVPVIGLVQLVVKASVDPRVARLLLALEQLSQNRLFVLRGATLHHSFPLDGVAKTLQV